MRIGLDLHGCIDRYPIYFECLTWNLINKGHEIHIITGQEWDKAEPQVNRYKISYTHSFSIVDYHKGIGTKMWKDSKDTWWLDETLWLKSKGDYIRKAKVDIHFDDGVRYAQYMPPTCIFVLVSKKGFDKKFMKMKSFIP
jgi:hypothetical protein